MKEDFGESEDYECPHCDDGLVTVPQDAKSGDTVTCDSCGYSMTAKEARGGGKSMRIEDEPVEPGADTGVSVPAGAKKPAAKPKGRPF